jgi:hypothetical protein
MSPGSGLMAPGAGLRAVTVGGPLAVPCDTRRPGVCRLDRTRFCMVVGQLRVWVLPAFRRIYNEPGVQWRDQTSGYC